MHCENNLVGGNFTVNTTNSVTFTHITKQEETIVKLHHVLELCHLFIKHSQEDGSQSRVFNLISNELVQINVQKSVLGIEERGCKTLTDFVFERLCGQTNL